MVIVQWRCKRGADDRPGLAWVQNGVANLKKGGALTNLLGNLQGKGSICLHPFTPLLNTLPLSKVTQLFQTLGPAETRTKVPFQAR